MVSTYRTERVIYCLEQNLKNFNEVREEYQESFNESYNHILNHIDELPEVMDDIDEDHNFDTNTFDEAKLLDFINFSKNFRDDYNFLPLSPALMFDKTWDNFLSAIDFYGTGVTGIYFNQFIFEIKSFSIMCQNLSKTGIIFLKQFKDDQIQIENLEHELLHSALDKYSSSFNNVKLIPYSPDNGFYVNANKTESSILEELIAGQGNLLKDTDGSISLLQGENYLANYIQDIQEHFGDENNLEINRIKDYIISRLSSDTECLVKLFLDFPSHIINPILFSVGSTSQMVDNLEIISPFNDFITWSEILENHKIYKKAKDILKSKGYRT